MKFALYAFLAACLSGVDDVRGQVSGYLKSKASTTRARSLTNPCLVLIVEVEYETSRKVDEPLACELRGDNVKGAFYTIVRVKGLTTSWAKKNNVTSGVTTLFANNSVIDDQTNELMIPKGQPIELGGGIVDTNPNVTRHLTEHTLGSMKRKLLSGLKTVLVIRAVQTTASQAVLQSDIFGGFGDSVNLNNQVFQCSRKQLKLVPLATNSLVGTDGVYTVTLPSSPVISGAINTIIETAMIHRTMVDLGTPAGSTLGDLADFVMVCVPPGTVGTIFSPGPLFLKWKTYSYVNHWLSVYNDNYCRSVSAQLLSFGRNINFGYSINDQSGMMGGPVTPLPSGDEFPRKCYNAPKTYQAGWYSSFHYDLNINNIPWYGPLFGFVDASSLTPLIDKMIVRIPSSTYDTYIHFNRASGMNMQTTQGANKVLITQRSSGTAYDDSYLVAELTGGMMHQIPNFDGTLNTLKIQVLAITNTPLPSRAWVWIYF